MILYKNKYTTKHGISGYKINSYNYTTVYTVLDN